MRDIVKFVRSLLDMRQHYSRQEEQLTGLRYAARSYENAKSSARQHRSFTKPFRRRKTFATHARGGIGAGVLRNVAADELIDGARW